MVVLAMVSLPAFCWLDFSPPLRKKSREAKTKEWLAIRQQTKRASSKLIDAVQKG